MMIDIADLIGGGLSPEVRQATRARLASLAISVGAFAAGCAVAALIYVVAHMGVFVLPPLVALIAALFPQTAAQTPAS